MNGETLVRCGHCDRLLRRAPRGDGTRDETSEVYSRTLVDDEFLPSCSPACHAELRRQIGRA